MNSKLAKENPARLAAAVAHKALHAIQLDLEERFGFDVYRFSESAGRLVSEDDIRDLWLFRGTFSASSGFTRTYEIFVGIRTDDENGSPRYERVVNAEILDPGNGGVEYKIEVPQLGEKGSVSIKDVRKIEVPEPDARDILLALDELMAKDHIGQEDVDE